MNNHQDFCARFNFHTLPFTREIQVKDRLLIPHTEKQLEYLFRVVDKRMSAALIAPAGTGKTLLLRSLVERIPQTRYRVHYVKVTSLSKRDLCQEIAKVVGCKPAGNYPTLVRRLQECFATSIDMDSLRPLLILDEAHCMRIDVMSILSILTNFDMDSRLVVSIIMAGQPPLGRLLQQDQLEDVARRMSHYASLQLLSSDELILYIKHRCQIAGRQPTCPFDSDALTALHEITRGNLRAIDHLALKSMEVAHDHNADTVNANHIVEAKGLLWV